MAIELGGMSAAAERLGLTQSAVSQAVKRAEVQIGCALVLRGRRPLVGTAAGRTLVEQVQAIAARTAVALEQVRSAGAGTVIRDLRLGMIDSFASTGGPPLIRELTKGNPAARIGAFSGLAPAQAEALLRNEIDIAITSDPMDGHDGLFRVPLYREPYVLACPASIAEELAGQPLGDILLRHRLVSYSARSRMGAHVARQLRRLRIDHASLLSFDTSDALLAMVAGGVGVAITTPLCVAQGGHQDPRLAILPLPKPGFSREITLVARRGEHEEACVSLADTARDIMGREVLPAIAAQIPWLAARTGEMLL